MTCRCKNQIREMVNVLIRQTFLSKRQKITNPEMSLQYHLLVWLVLQTFNREFTSIDWDISRSLDAHDGIQWNTPCVILQD
jgi:hypothetical protein